MKAARLLIAAFTLILCLLFAATTASANVTLKDPIQDLTITEDEVAENLFNLNNHFSDGQTGLSFSAVSADNKIDVNIKEDASVDLTPPKNWFGTEEITFIATDGDQKVSDTVLITVEPVNDRPLLISHLPDSISFSEDTEIPGAFNLYNHFMDIDSLLTFSYNSENIRVNIESNGDVSLSAPSNWFGSEDVEFFASDGEFTLSDTISISVNPQNDEPVCNVNIEPISLKEESRSQILDLGDYFTDVEDDILTFEVTGNNHVNYEVDSENSKLRIFAPDSWSGKEIITITASDSAGSTKSIQVVVVASPAYDSQGQVFYLAGLVLGLSVVGVKLQHTGRRKDVKSPVSLTSYRHYKGN